MNSSSSIDAFLKSESAGGILLMFAALLAMLVANSFLADYYQLLLSTPVEIRVGQFEIAKPLLLWINDGLMAIFFFVVGLELKRELLEGELAERKKIIFPLVGALGGMLVPAAIYLIFNWHNPETRAGWAIPAATDIAFALGVLSLLGSRVPISIKIFLTSLAIFDDIGAIVIIALFYTSKISLSALLVALLCVLCLWLLNRANVISKSAYLLIGVVMWTATLKSGVHATLAGVVLAMFIPLTSNKERDSSPLKTLEHDLHSVVAFGVLPIFAFFNAGIDFSGVSLEHLLHPVPVGIALGLFVGKQVGIFSFCWLAVKCNLSQLPAGISWASLYASAALCGIGFTMSLFIGSLAFDTSSIKLVFDERLGVMMGSLFAGLVGYFLLNKSLPKAPAKHSADDKIEG